MKFLPFKNTFINLDHVVSITIDNKNLTMKLVLKDSKNDLLLHCSKEYLADIETRLMEYMI